MRVLILTQHFPPEMGAGQTRLHELATGLVSLGHHVSVLTAFPNYPTGIVPPEWRGRFFMHHLDNSVHIYRIWSHPAPNGSIIRRIISNASYAVLTSVVAPMLPKFDALIVESHPLLNGIAGMFISWAKNLPCILNVSDLWPENAVQLGVLKNRLLISLCRTVAHKFYRHASVILAMTRYIEEKIADEGIDSSKIVLFRNCVNVERFQPLQSSVRAKLGIGPERFVAVYAGTFGLCNYVTGILDAAAMFQGECDARVHFVIAGDGVDREKLKAYAAQLQLRNVTFLNSVPKDAVADLVNAGNCAVISLRDLELLRGTLPRKMFEAMACGLPIVLGGEAEPEVMLREANGGICVRPEDAQGLHDAIAELVADRERARQLGLNGRAYVLQHFDRNRRARDLAKAIDSAVSGTGDLRPAAGSTAAGSAVYRDSSRAS